MLRYGRNWPNEYSDLDIEKLAFRTIMEAKITGKSTKGLMPAHEHFWNIVDILWPQDGPQIKFTRHPWADKMIEEACRWEYLAVSGGSGIGKSQAFAIWALVNWIVAPFETKVLVTSVTLAGARSRIWAPITDYFNALRPEHCPGKLTDATGIIRTQIGNKKGSQKCGIQLVAGDKSQTEQSSKIIGIHNQFVLLIGDELTDLQESLINAAKSNLKGNPRSQFIGIGNPKSRFDPHGQLSEPMDGWKTIDETTTEWRTKLGYAIRFDGEQSPNILAGRTIYSFLPTVEHQDAASVEGRDSLSYWRMFRAFWAPEGTGDGSIYTDSEFDDAVGQCEFVGEPTAYAACDMSWAHGGDQSWGVVGHLGTLANGNKALLIKECRLLVEKKSIKRERVYQIVDQFRALCSEWGVTPRNACYDSTGGGALFGNVLIEESKVRDWAGITFADEATKTPAGPKGRPANELYADRVSELWLVGKDFLRGGQLFGFNTRIIADLVARREDPGKYGKGGKQAVEPKRTMKKRIKRSPDLGDTVMLLLDICRQRGGFRPAAVRARNIANEEALRKIRDRERIGEEGSAPMNLMDAPMDRQSAHRHKYRPVADEENEFASAFGQ